MIYRLVSVWICAALAVWVDLFLWIASFALSTRKRELFNGKPLPGLTEWFLSPNFNDADSWPTWPYYFPLLVVGGAAWVTWRHRRDTDKTVLFCVSTLALTLGFLAVFLCAMAIPFVSFLSSLRH